jgi:hypothetical protein
MERTKLTLDEVRSCFSREFGPLENKFAFYNGDTSWARESKEEFVANPGVYVWWHPQRGVLRVGVSMQNSRKRALRHITDDTGEIMKALSTNPETKLLLFNIKDGKDSHWVLALEKYFEKSLEPELEPKRYG